MEITMPGFKTVSISSRSSNPASDGRDRLY
jgi:hypothetical protein